jgi:macrolide transport system ATP-binding/permease protein
VTEKGDAMNFASRLYQHLAKAFPHEFKLAYGTDLMQLGDDVVKDIATRHGITGLFRPLADIAIRVPIEYLSEMRGDMRYALRALIKSPGFALVGILSLGIGMGLTTNLFNSRWQSIFRELPAAANAQRLAMPEKPVSYYYIEQFREQKNLLTGVAAFQTGIAFNIALQSINSQNDAQAKPERVFGQLVSPDYFSVLGVQAQRGRMLSAEIDKPGDSPVVVISDRFWRNRLNSSPDAVGRAIRINTQPVTIVGIAPKDFNGVLPENPSEVFVPITAPASLAPELANDVLHQRNAKVFIAMLCMAPGVSLESAEAALDAITRHLDQQDASTLAVEEKGRRVTLLPAGTMVPLPRNLKPVVIGFFAVLMVLIMTIACMNLANMLLARGANRRKELAIRLAIGASRFRLVRQMMSEGILLSLLGGIAGFGMAYWISAVKSKIASPTPVPIQREALPDWHAGIFVFALSILCGIAFSLIPALRATKAEMFPALKQGSALQVPGYRRFGLRNLLMIGQVTGSLMLLLITGFLVIGFSQVSGTQTNFDPHTMFLLSLDPMRDGYSPEKTQALFENLPQQLKNAGAIRNVTLAAQPPLSIQDEEDGTVQFTTEDSSGTPHIQHAMIKESVGAGYFSALSEDMLAGREFTELDQRTDSAESRILPVVLNESAARTFFGHGNALGKHIRQDRQSYEIVGVVHDFKNGVSEGQLVAYLPLTQQQFAHPPADGMTVMVRSDAGADTLGRIRKEIASIDPNLNVFNTRTLSDYLQVSRSSQRFAIRTYGAIGIFGLVLSAIGLAGVTAYAVAQRRREIGIRMALGARKGQVLLLVLREGTALVCVGTLLGLLGAFGLAKMLSALTSVFVNALNVGTGDLRLIIGAPLLLATLALLACYIPARKAASIDPLNTLREG